MIVYALDTNIITYYIANSHNIRARILERVDQGHKVLLSPIGYYEA